MTGEKDDAGTGHGISSRGVETYILRGKKAVRVLDITEWGRWMEENRTTNNRIVEQTQIGSIWVSTVFLGLDHNWAPNGPPLLFETMVFSDGDEHDEFPQERYSTYDEAEKGHEQMVRHVRESHAVKGFPRPVKSEKQ